MGSVLALVSKAIFEKQAPRAALGDRLALDRYTSANKGLLPLESGGALFLVTVRPPERLWLCAVLEAPAFDGTAWKAEGGAAPVVDVTDLLPQIRLANGKGIQAPEGKLGMSLQTPRALSEEDAALLREATGGAVLAAPPPKRAAKAAAQVAPPVAAPPPAQSPLPKPAPRVAAKADGDLYAQIVADPDDLGLRGVYADRLIEEGDPHGEYIQFSCAAAELPAGDPKRLDLEARARELRRRHGLAFSRPLRKLAWFNRSPEGKWEAPFHFDNGFADTLGGDAKLLDHLEEAVKVAPVRGLRLRELSSAAILRLAAMPLLGRVRSIQIEQATGASAASILALVTSPHLRRLERLSIAAQITPELVRAIASAPHLAGLASLTLSPFTSPSKAGAPLAAALAASPGLQGLKELELHEFALGADGAAALATLPALERLTIQDDALGPKGAQALASAPALASLRALSLTRCELGGEKGFAALVSSPSFTGLEELTIAGPNALNGKKLAPLLGAMALPRLRALRLEDSPLRVEGATALVAASKKLASLTELALRAASLKDDGMAILSRATLPKLEVLDLGGNGIGPDGMEALGAGALIRSVRELSIRNNKCGGDGGKMLGKSKHLGKLRSLSLFYNWMGVHGVRALLAAAPGLEELYAGENNYTDAPARFVASEGMKNLRVLHVTEIAEATVEALAKGPSAGSLAELSFSSGAIGEAGAEALAALEGLERLDLSFITCDAPVRALLRRRFGPNLSVWGRSGKEWDAPGPE